MTDVRRAWRCPPSSAAMAGPARLRHRAFAGDTRRPTSRPTVVSHRNPGERPAPTPGDQGLGEGRSHAGPARPDALFGEPEEAPTERIAGTRGNRLSSGQRLGGPTLVQPRAERPRIAQHVRRSVRRPGPPAAASARSRGSSLRSRCGQRPRWRACRGAPTWMRKASSSSRSSVVDSTWDQPGA